MKWLIAVVAVAAITWFGMQYMDKQAAEEVAAQEELAAQVAAEKAEAIKLQLEVQKTVADSAAVALTAAQTSMPTGVDLSKISGALNGVFGTTSEALSGITDLESAKNAIPSLQEAAGKLSGLKDVMARLPEAAKGPLGSIVQAGINVLQPLVDKIVAMPVVGALIKPVVTPIMEMLDGMAG
jgi:hypothetical protein